MDRAEAQAIVDGVYEEEDDDKDLPAWSVGEGTPKTPAGTKGGLTIRTSPSMSCVGERSLMSETGPPSNMRIIDLTWDEEEGSSSKKRKRMNTETENKDKEDEWKREVDIQQKLIQLIKAMDKEVKKIGKIVTENPNTKRELKDSSAYMRSVMAKIMTNEAYNLMREQKNTKKTTASVNDAECQTDEAAGKTREMATQTIETITEEDGHRRVKSEEIRKVSNYEEFTRIRNYDWPEETYTASKHEEGLVTQAPKEYDIVVWDEGDAAGEQTKRAMRRYPELCDLEGETAYLYLTTKSENAQGILKTIEQVIMKYKTDDSEADCWKKLTEIRRMEERHRTEVAMYPPGEDARGKIFRKMVECVFVASKIKCSVWHKRSNKKREDNKRQNATDAIIVSQKGKTYADLLKTIKSGMKEEGKEVTDHIEAIRQTKEGTMLITKKANEDKTKEVRGVISKIEGIKTRTSAAGRSKRKVIHVKGMDAITSKEEVLAAIVRETGAEKETVRVGEMRPFYGSSKAVTIVVPEKEAEKLVKKGRLRIEYNWCRVEMRVDLIQCYRCWRYGHTAVLCEAPEDRSGDCKNYGEGGHMRKNCDKEKQCPICEVKGHSAGTGACRETRRALRRAREEEIKGAGETRKVQENKKGQGKRPEPRIVTIE